MTDGAHTSERPSMSRRILVVDDEPNVRMTLVEALEPLGYDVQTAASGDEALPQLADPRVELILLDLKMPGPMSGLDVLEHIEHERPGLRVIVITAHGSLDNAVESMKHGALDVIQKPFSLDDIRELVQRQMDEDGRVARTARSYEGHLARATELIRTRRLDAAEEHVEKALVADESRPEAFNLAGVLAALRMDRVAAQKKWRLALAHDPTYEPAKRNLSRSTHPPSERGALDLGDARPVGPAGGGGTSEGS